MTTKGVAVEVQIRTEEMHRLAEEGIASHWKYKEGRIGAANDERYFQWLRQTLEWQQDVRDPQEFIQNLKVDLYPDEVYTFTPKGQVKSLPRDATVIDFAYSIHTDVGHQCIGARINGKMMPLRTRLKNGDIVEIVTNAKHRPSRDWLNFVVTTRARNRIKGYLHAEEKERAVELGRKLLEKDARRFTVNLKALLDGQALDPIAPEWGVPNGLDLLAAIGYGRVGARQVLTKFVPADQLKERRESAVTTAVKKVISLGTGGDSIKVSGADDVLVVRARCCNPIHGERIVGYITRGKGVSVHAASCPNVTNLLYDPERRIDVEWNKAAKPGQYTVRLSVEVEDRKGLVAAVSAKIAGVNTNIVDIEARTDSEQRGWIRVTIEISDMKHLEKVMKSLRGIPGVLGVERARAVPLDLSQPAQGPATGPR
jgi:GTP pyrophosphokinase